MLTLPIGPLAGLAQVQEPGGTGSEARGGRGVEPMNTDNTTIRQLEFELEKAEHGMALPYDGTGRV